MNRAIPHDRRGYSIDLRTRTVHTRYPTHGEVRPRVRDMRAVRAYLQGDDGRPCEACWPAPPVEPRTARSRPPAVDDVKAVVVRAADEVLGPEAAAIVAAGFDTGFDAAAATRGRGRVRIDAAGEPITALEALQTLTVEPEPAGETAEGEDAVEPTAAEDPAP
jgi:hypothetical protein